LLAIVLVASGGIWTGQVHAQLSHWNLLPKTQSVVELSFANPALLPTTYRPGDYVSVDFIVHNTSHEMVTYEYSVGQYSDTRDFMNLHDATVTLKPGAQEIITHAVQVRQQDESVAIGVQSKDGLQKINFWIQRL